MGIDMEVLHALSALRNPILDGFFLLVTRLGEEFLFMAVALAVFWCGNKNRGYFLLVTGFVGTIANQALKLLCRVPRPWVRDTGFEPIAAAKKAATGYSFPSGHTQVATGLYGGIARTSKRRLVSIGGWVLALLVGFSRLWLGVHTPSDVLFSLAFGVILVLLLVPLFRAAERKPLILYLIAGGMLLLAILNLLIAESASMPQNMSLLELHSALVNIAEAQKNAWSLLGAALGLPFILFVDARYLHFDGRAKPLLQIVKVALGLFLLFLLKEGLKIPFDALFGENGIKHALRYFLVVVFAGCLYPALFRFLR